MLKMMAEILVQVLVVGFGNAHFVLTNGSKMISSSAERDRSSRRSGETGAIIKFDAHVVIADGIVR